MIEQDIQSQTVEKKTSPFFTLEVSSIPSEYYFIIQNNIEEIKKYNNEETLKQARNSKSQLNDNNQNPVVEFNELNL